MDESEKIIRVLAKKIKFFDEYVVGGISYWLCCNCDKSVLSCKCIAKRARIWLANKKKKKR